MAGNHCTAEVSISGLEGTPSKAFAKGRGSHVTLKTMHVCFKCHSSLHERWGRHWGRENEDTSNVTKPPTNIRLTRAGCRM